jgi:hypothetical protein
MAQRDLDHVPSVMRVLPTVDGSSARKLASARRRRRTRIRFHGKFERELIYSPHARVTTTVTQ